MFVPAWLLLALFDVTLAEYGSFAAAVVAAAFAKFGFELLAGGAVVVVLVLAMVAFEFELVKIFVSFISTLTNQ
jgi:hypothetical protein